MPRIFVSLFVLLTAFFVGLLLSACNLSISAKTTYKENSLLRLHIVPHSNGVVDQDIKLLVRNAVTREASAIFEGVASLESALLLLDENWHTIQETAERVLEEQGVSYPLRLVLGTFSFPERTYQELVLPEGEYLALRIILGEGKGDNWWCLMFPPLCLNTFPEEPLVKQEESQDTRGLQIRLRRFDVRLSDYRGRIPLFSEVVPVSVLLPWRSR